MTARPGLFTGEQEAQIRGRLAAWRRHPEYEDLLQEARLAAWWLLEQHPEAGGLVGRAARFAALHYLSGPRTVVGVRQSWAKRGIEPALSLNAVEKQRLATSFSGWWGDTEIEEAEPAAPDFVPALLDAIDGRAHWEAMRRCLTPKQWQAVRLCYGWGLSLKEAGALLNEKESTVSERCREGLARYRLHLGLPAKEKQQRRRPNRSKSHCPRGHSLSGANLYHWAGDNRRRCRACQQERAGCSKRKSSDG